MVQFSLILVSGCLCCCLQMFVNQMFQPSGGNPQPHMVPTTSNYNQAPISVPMSMTNQTYSPSSRPMMIPDSMSAQPAKLEDSPPATGQGDIGPRPIGGERSRRTPLFVDPAASIWGSKPQG